MEDCKTGCFGEVTWFGVFGHRLFVGGAGAAGPIVIGVR